MSQLPEPHWWRIVRFSATNLPPPRHPGGSYSGRGEDWLLQGDKLSTVLQISTVYGNVLELDFVQACRLCNARPAAVIEASEEFQHYHVQVVPSLPVRSSSLLKSRWI
jgi:hypothetical protein